MSTQSVPVPKLARQFSDSWQMVMQQYFEHVLHTKKQIQCRDDWSRTRQNVAVVTDSVAIEVVVGLVMLGQLAVSIIATDAAAAGQAPQWVEACMVCFAVVYCAEIALRMYVHRLAFFSTSLNVLDILIVAAELMGIVFGMAASTNLTPLRIIRVVRWLRSAKILFFTRSLYVYFNGMSSAMAAVMWSLIMISIALIMCSVFAVEVIQPYVLEMAATTDVFDGCSRCPIAYSSVWHAYVTSFQGIVAGDSWGLIAVPVMDEHPWTAVFFVPSLLFIHFGLINMILAVIVDKAADAKETNVSLTLALKQEERMRTLKDMQVLFLDMDTDMSGELTLEEILNGFDNNHEFRNILSMMDIGKEDMEAVFRILDTDRSGSCTYEEFVTALRKMKMDSDHTMLVFIKSYVLDVKYSLEQLVKSQYVELASRLVDLRPPAIGDNISPSFSYSHITSSASFAQVPSVHAEVAAAHAYKRMTGGTGDDGPCCENKPSSGGRQPRPVHQGDTAEVHKKTSAGLGNCENKPSSGSRQPLPVLLVDTAEVHKKITAGLGNCENKPSSGSRQPLAVHQGDTAEVHKKITVGLGNCENKPSSGSRQPLPVLVGDTAEVHKKITAGLGNDGLLGIERSGKLPPLHPEAKTVEASTSMKEGADFFMGTANVEAKSVVRRSWWSNSFQNADYSLDTLSNLIEAPPAHVPARTPAAWDASRNQVENKFQAQSRQPRKVLPVQRILGS